MARRKKKYRILDIRFDDAFYRIKNELVGKVGTFEQYGDNGDGWLEGYFRVDNGLAGRFWCIKLEEVKS